MTKDIFQTIQTKISELHKNLTLLKIVSADITQSNLKEDMIKYWGIERGLQISIECIIDIANIIISSLDVQKPDTYKESIIELAKHNIIPGKFSDKIANMVSFRNILVHDYMKIDEKIMVKILRNNLDDIIKFADYINKWISKNY